MFRREARALAALIALGLASPAAAQALTCRVPERITLPRLERYNPAERRTTPITRYTLALSWSPSFCEDGREGFERGSIQCDATRGSFGFILHGLWPEGATRQWPQYCAPVGRVPPNVLRRHMCITPSPELLQHEWARHGRCMSRTPADYFAVAEREYRRVRFPDMRDVRLVNVGDLKAAFVRANPGLTRDMLAVETNRADRSLREVRICMDRSFGWAHCPAWQRGAPDSVALRIVQPRPVSARSGR